MYNFNSSVKINYHPPPHTHPQILSITFCLCSVWCVNHMDEFPHQRSQNRFSWLFNITQLCQRQPLCHSHKPPACLWVLIPALLFPSQSSFLQTFFCHSLPSLSCGCLLLYPPEVLVGMLYTPRFTL